MLVDRVTLLFSSLRPETLSLVCPVNSIPDTSSIGPLPLILDI